MMRCAMICSLLTAVMLFMLLPLAASATHDWDPYGISDSAFVPGDIEDECVLEAFSIEDKEFSLTSRMATNVAGILQYGDGNVAKVKQHGAGNAAGIWQLGNSNDAEVFQQGQSNVAGIGQYGIQHDTTIEQYGNDHSALVIKIGAGIKSNITQSGDDSSIEVLFDFH